VLQYCYDSDELFAFDGLQYGDRNARYKIILFNLAVRGGGWSKAWPRPFYRRETDLVPTVQLDGPQGRSVQVPKASPTTGNGSPDRPPRSESDVKMNTC